LSPKCRRAPWTSLENPPGMLLLLRCRTDYAVRCRRHFDSQGRTFVLCVARRFVAGIEREGLRKAAGGKCSDFADPNRAHACKKGIGRTFPSGRGSFARSGMTSALYPIGRSVGGK
jgi:hypothetical protein